MWQKFLILKTHPMILQKAISVRYFFIFYLFFIFELKIYLWTSIYKFAAWFIPYTEIHRSCETQVTTLHKILKKYAYYCSVTSLLTYTPFQTMLFILVLAVLVTHHSIHPRLHLLEHMKNMNC